MDDAVQAFLYTAASAFSTFGLYNYEHSRGKLGWTYVGIALTGIFHASNIIGAGRTAEYRNWKRHSDFVSELHDAIIALEP